jgi:hypothetical protein
MESGLYVIQELWGIYYMSQYSTTLQLTEEVLEELEVFHDRVAHAMKNRLS